MNIHDWALKWNIPLAALRDMQERLGLFEDYQPKDGERAERLVQADVRVEASQLTHRLWRNNVGALQNEHGTWVRYGLANESKQMNKVIKSGDLIGIRRVLITQAHVGTVIGQFCSREVKDRGWTYSASEREEAQLKWAQMVISLGGDAAFVTGPGSFD